MFRTGGWWERKDGMRKKNNFSFILAICNGGGQLTGSDLDFDYFYV
jgi:hypothetical protein